ncbi:MAG: sulfite dehydrogenase [SAR86 cluster bacterium]|uniref:Sulfite dehydrogenase n=1 Tax=SAR86 cluster bacterium TaxID=2030880 RepID=A0A2A5CAM1_9GAMM|nr:MAG: sulfite dehydrogenase [SAR86 cluster bacterium]
MSETDNPNNPVDQIEQVAANGLLHRRAFLKTGALVASATPFLSAKAAPPEVDSWSTVPGRPPEAYGNRSEFESDVTRLAGFSPPALGAGASRAPLGNLEGIITPSALHFERHHNGIPNIDPAEHRLLIHGLVDKPLIFDMEALSRYPLVSRIQFLECSGNSRALDQAQPVPGSAQSLHGLLSCSEWTGVPLSILLDEAGVQTEGKWVLAEGADSSLMTRSIPMSKIRDDAIVAIYQNGERLRPGNGYPMRLFLPGWEGNTSVKWLRRLKVTAEPTMTRDETSKYSDLQPDGTAQLFSFQMGVKSVITSPSGEQTMRGPGLYQISGIAWTGAGSISRVEVSADGGRTWGEAELTEPVLSKALTRFRMPWRWNGEPVILQSRAIDETGAVQPTRTFLLNERGPQYGYHNHAIQSWQISANGEVSNVYA